MKGETVRRLIADGEVIWMPWCTLDALQLVSGDIKKAIAFFSRQTGTEAKAITLNPKNEKLVGEIQDGIQVSYCGGCLLWEVWLSATRGGNFGTPQSAEIRPSGAFQNSGNSGSHVGRPRKGLPVEKMHQLKAGGAGVREIARALDLPLATVSRALGRAREGAGEARQGQ